MHGTMCMHDDACMTRLDAVYVCLKAICMPPASRDVPSAAEREAARRCSCRAHTRPRMRRIPTGPLPHRVFVCARLLCAAGRLKMLPEICENFEELYCKLTDTQIATLRSAVKLEQEQQFLIAKKLQELTGSKNIKLKPVIDQSLIAGFVVEYGSSQVDLSVRGQVERVGEQIAREMTVRLA